MAVYKFDQFRAEAGVEPFELDFDGQIFSIPAPTAETMMVIGETPAFQSRKLLRLLLGEQHDAVWALVQGEQGAPVTAMVVEMVKHFKIGEAGNVPGGFAALPR